ncbi:MAG: multidrug effflux MFS transporter [Burkholderiales bacterium]|jgi:DHA1 family bicyclomycin/chloramphenicol resistance-like MFS transporter|nr:multidrug effflux MFS transporter [Nitrosomonadaceae bacterium]
MSPPSRSQHSPERPHAHHATPKWLLALLLAALGMLGPFAVDTYIPAFPSIATDLGATTLQMQQTFSVYLFAFAFMFLFHGALSDSFGRKPVILGGLIVFFVASVGCALSTTISQLLFWRAMQGLSVGAGMVVGRAMVRDLYGDVDAQRIMSMVTLWFGIAPAIAPILGGFLYTGLGWHSIFWFIAAFTLLLIVLSARVIHETLPHERRQPFKPGPLVEGYRQVGANAPLILLSLAAGFNFNGFFLYILSAPIYLPQQLGLGPTEYAWLFAPGIGGIMLGAFISGRVAGKWKPEKTIRAGYMIMLAAASINVAYAVTGKPSLPWAVIPIGCYAVGSALAFPSLSIMVMNLFPARRGMATSLSGFITGMVNVLVAGLISPALSHSHIWLSLGMGGLMVTGFTCWYTYRRLTGRHRHANAG